MRESIVWLRRLVFEYGSSPPISLDLCVDDEDPSQLIIRPGWDAPHVRCFPRMFYAWPCLLRQVGTVLGSPHDYVVEGLAYANPGSRQEPFIRISIFNQDFLAYCDIRSMVSTMPKIVYNSLKLLSMVDLPCYLEHAN